ncbi:MAG: DegT/DnrJ/EryC1/StrS family aminotransferase [Blastocatellia bacterium]
MTTEPILQSDPKAGYLAHREEIDRAIAETLASGWYILGKQVASFEREFAAYLGAEFCVGVASGTDAISIALRCLTEPGDLVITSSHTAVATVVAIEMAGAVPLFVDIDPESYTIDPRLIEEAITTWRGKGRIRAIVPVHLYGHPAGIDALASLAREHEMALVEDCAQAHGATLHGRRVGTFGEMGAFSFYPTKNLGALGDGGAIVTSDPALAETAARVREYGWRDRYVSLFPGVNSRLDEIQAAVLRVRLRNLEQENHRRRQIAAIYDQELADTPLRLPQRRPDATHVYHQYVVRSDDRDALRQHLQSRAIGTLIHYPMPIHRQPAYLGRYPVHRTHLPVTDQTAAQILSLPIHPHLTDTQAARVCQEIRAFFHI